MKIGTAPKITIGAIGIIALIFISFIGSRQLLSSKDNVSRSVKAVGQTSDTTAESVVQTDATGQNASTTPSPEAERPISEEERQQIERFFSQFEQLEETDKQSEADTPQPSTESESEIEPPSTDTDVPSSTTEQSAEDVMNAFVEAYKNFDIEAMLPLTTGAIKEELDNAREDMAQSSQDLEIQAVMQLISQVEIAGSEYVGEEFHFRLRIPTPEIPGPPEMPELPDSVELVVKMQKVDGAWRIYDGIGPGN